MKKLLLPLLLLILSGSVFPEDSEIKVDDIKLPEISWGEREATFNVTNHAPYPKYLVVKTAITIDNEQTTEPVQSSFYLPPENSAVLIQKLDIPGSFGGGSIEFEFYDVLDTLDQILDYQLFETKKFEFTFKIPDGIKPYVAKPTFFPPRVIDHPFFKDDFVKIMIVMLADGKTIEDIQKVTQANIDFILNKANILVGMKYLKKENDVYSLNFPFIKEDEAREIYAIAEQTSDKLALNIEKHMPGYWDKVDSLAETRIIPRDKNDFLSGATLIYNPHAMVSVMLMWYDLGRKFITRSAPLLIFDGTDFCNADIYQYMYAIHADSQYYNEQLFFFSLGSNSYSMTYSRTDPEIQCVGDYRLYNDEKVATPKWRYTHPDYPEFFIADTATANPFLNMLDQGLDTVLFNAYGDINKINEKYGHPRVDFGYRYWFWSLASELTLSKLEAKGVIEKPENAYYRFDSIKRK